MKKISVDQIQEGMILAQDVAGLTGSAILHKGTPLNPHMVKRLKNWGVSSVVIEGKEEIVSHNPKASASLDTTKKNLEATFGELLENPIMSQIFSAVMKFRSKKNETQE